MKNKIRPPTNSDRTKVALQLMYEKNPITRSLIDLLGLQNVDEETGEVLDIETIFNEDKKQKSKVMAKSKFKNEVEVKNYEFFNFTKGEPVVFTGLEKHSISFGTEAKQTFKTADEEGNIWIMPTNVGLQKKISQLFDLSKNPEEVEFEVTLTGEEKVTKGKVYTWSVKY